ncbi:MAG TPA: RNA methyltransferase [Burkholderiales bacterium]
MTTPPPLAAVDSPLARVRVVLVQTSHPGNIGAAARAMKTMGIEALTLVRPRHFPHDEAQAMASRATDILAAARVCGTLDEALAGTVFAVACTARSRDLSHPVLTPREAAARMIEEARRGPVALVMGPEKYGLKGQDVNRCSVISTVPANPEYSSLNLAAAVQLFAYEVRLAAERIETLPQENYPPAPHEDVEQFIAHLEQTMIDIGFLDPASPKRLMQRMRRLFARARLEREEVNILRGILAAAQAAARRRT